MKGKEVSPSWDLVLLPEGEAGNSHPSCLIHYMVRMVIQRAILNFFEFFLFNTL